MVEKEILDKLKEIERQENFKIIYACQQGSRAWGFASKDSDYDVRFIYIRSLKDYMETDHKDYVDYNDGLLDISGVDLYRAIHGIYLSLPAILEWLYSPKVYFTTPLFEELKEVSKRYFDGYKMASSYRSIATMHYDRIEGKKDVKIIDYFYSIRALLACLYILENNQMPPLDYSSLEKEMLKDENLLKDMQEILELKLTKDQNVTIPLKTSLNCYIVDSIFKVSQRLVDYQFNDLKEKRPLNDVFIKALQTYEGELYDQTRKSK